MPRGKAATAAANGAAGKKVAKPRAPKGAYQLADPMPEGETLTDLAKKQWRSGKAVGSGGFGLLYLASPADSSAKSDPQYVLKVEPHQNGPLFCELAFYQRVAKPEMISKWMSEHKVKTLGVPRYIAAGSHIRNGQRYRFMIMERYGTDLQKVFESNGNRFQRKTVYQLAVKLLDALQYVHEHEYVHADIKASNLLMGYTKGTTDQVYLVDYGLAFRYVSGGAHKEYKEDPRRAHDGTIEFTSRDAHRGVNASRRSDLEILGYCLLQWLCGRLPWEDNLNNKDWVRDQKFKYMKDIPSLMKKCFPGGETPDVIQKYLTIISKMEYTEVPAYDKLRGLFRQAMKPYGVTEATKMDLTMGAASPKKGAKSKPAAAKASPAKRGPKRKSASPVREEEDSEEEEDESEEEDSEEEDSPPKKPAAKGRGRQAVKSPCNAAKRSKIAVSPAPSKPAASSKYSPANSIIPGLSSVRPPPTNGAAASTSKAKLSKKKKAEMCTSATQTSPGLKGLPRSWKKTNKQK